MTEEHGPYDRAVRRGPDAVTRTTFPTTFRGYDPEAVKAFLASVADQLREAQDREALLRAELHDAEAKAAEASGVDDAKLTVQLGEEMAKVLAAARQAAADIRAKADERAATALRQADEDAARLRAEAEGVLARRTEAAASEGDRIVAEATMRADATVADAGRRAKAARDEAERVLSKARDEAARTTVQASDDAAQQRQRAQAQRQAEVDAGRAEGRRLVEQAQAVRVRVLKDLARRRKALRVQLEQLRAARERLIGAYELVQRTLDEATSELRVSLPEAKVAAEAAGRRAKEDPEDSVEALEAEIDAARSAGLPFAVAGSGAAAAAAPGWDDRPPAHPVLASPPAPPAETEAEADAGAGAGAESEVETGTGTDRVEDGGRSSAGESPASEGAVAGRGAAATTPGTGTTVDVVPVATKAPADQDEADGHGAGNGTASDVGNGEKVARTPRKPWPWRRPPEPTEVGFQPLEAVPPYEGVRVVPGTGMGDVAGTVAGDDLATADATVAPAETVDLPDTAASSPPVGLPTDTAADSPAEPVAQAAGVLDAPLTPVEASRDEVDDLFARLRTSRQSETTRARQVLAGEVDDTEAGTDAAPTMVVVPPGAAPVGEDDQALLRRRDELTDVVEQRVCRRLKRLLADEQNEVLDRLRRTHATTVDELLPEPGSQSAQFADAVTADLIGVASAGSTFDGAGGETNVVADVGDLAGELAHAVVDLLRDRLEASARDAAGDEEALAEGIRSCYREWKSQRLGAEARHSVLAAFNRGLYGAVPDGAGVRWLVDTGGAPCPDAEDNALAGTVVRGEAFPTGHCYPPAHPGCRCLLVAVGPASG